MTKIRFRRLSMVVGVLTAAVLFQGCLLADKIIADFYPAVFRIPDGVEQEVSRTIFPIRYCNDTLGSIRINGSIFQTNPRPSWLYHKFVHLDELDNPIRVVGVNAMVDPITGDIQGDFPNVIPPGCFGAGHKLVTSVQPNGGDIDEGATVAHALEFLFGPP